MTILIDSDILIEVSRGRNEEVLAKWARLADGESALLCSPVTVAELWHGARSSEHGILNSLFTALVCVPIDHEIGRRAGDYLRQYRSSHNMELADALIAATASIHGATLWTRNRKHYPMKAVAFY
jgi:predicted nucleic acid-binding protein